MVITMCNLMKAAARLSAAAFLPALASAGVLVVGPPGSGAAFSDVQPAIDAAQPGDTILVLAGSYGPANIAKPLQILGVGSNRVTLTGPDTAPVLEVSAIPAGETLVVAGIDFQAESVFFSVQQVMARIQGNAGTIVLQDVRLDDVEFPYKTGGLSVTYSALVLDPAAQPRARRFGGRLPKPGGPQAIVADSLDVEGGEHDHFKYHGSAEDIVVAAGSSLFSSPFLYPTLAASEPTVVGGNAVVLQLRGNPFALGWFAFGSELATPASLPGIDGATLLSSGMKLLGAVPLDASS